MFKKTFQEKLLTLLHAVKRGNYKAIINEGLCWYLNKVHKIISADKGSLHQWFKGVFFALYDYNAGPLDGTDITWLVLYIGREFTFLIHLYP